MHAYRVLNTTTPSHLQKITRRNPIANTSATHSPPNQPSKTDTVTTMPPTPSEKPPSLATHHPPHTPKKPTNLFAPTPPSFPDRLIHEPLLTLISLLYNTQPPIHPPPPAADAHPIRVVCISDTHTLTPTLPPCDLLLHAGDLSNSGSTAEVRAQLSWLGREGERLGAKVVIIAGNHDLVLDESCWDNHGERFSGEADDGVGTAGVDWGRVTCLQNSSARVEVRGGGRRREVHVYGAPQTRKQGNWAFQYGFEQARGVWRGTVPSHTDILLTHSPAKGHRDGVGRAGCAELLREVWRVKPLLHVHGHIHSGRGVEVLDYGVVQSAYERVVCGEGGWRGWGLLLVAVEAWVWAWVAWLVLGRRRVGRTVVVNAAWEGNEGRGVTVVEM